MWQQFGIPGDRALESDATWIRRLKMLAAVRGGEE